MQLLALEDLFPFGKYEGEQVEDILCDDPQYLVWLYEKDVDFFDQDVVKELENKKLI